MRIFEVKNNLVKLFFNEKEKLFLSGFLMIKDTRQTYIAQIMHIEANKHGNIAIARLIYNVDSDGSLTSFEGTVPSSNSVIALLNLADVVKLFESDDSITIGELSQDNIPLKVDFTFVKNKLLVLGENQENLDTIVRNLNNQIKQFNKRTIIIDTVGTYDKLPESLIAGKNFKLPVNYNMLGFISENGIDYKTPKSKAIIQETFLELQYYVKTIENQYIPVNSLIDILEEQYKSSKLLELVLIKNALIKYQEQGILAESKKDFLSLNKSLIENSTTVIDLSNVEDNIQREYISYIYEKLSKLNEEVIVFVNINNKNSDKKLLKQLYFTKNISTITEIPYEYKYLNELKKISKNMIMFTPTFIQDDFDAYNIFLNKLSKWEYIVFGQETQYLPLIATLKREKGVYKDSISAEDIAESVVSTRFRDRMKNLVQKQYDEILGVQQNERARVRSIEKHQIENQEMMQQQMQQLYQQQNTEMLYSTPQYNYSPAYMQQMAQQQAQQMQPYFCPQQMPMQMPYQMMMQPQIMPQPYMQMQMPMQMPYQQQVYPQTQNNQGQVVNQNSVRGQDIISPEEVSNNFDMKQLDKLYSNSPVEDVFKNIQIDEQYQEESVEQPNQQSQKEIIVEEIKSNEQNQNEVIKTSNNSFKEENVVIFEEKEEDLKQEENQIPQDEEELTEDDLDMISELDVELHEANMEEIKEQERVEEIFVPKYVEEPEEASLPVFPQPELMLNNSSELSKNDRVRHAKFGEGIVEKVINYGNKKLCSIYFEQVGRRLLEPNISELEKI